MRHTSIGRHAHITIARVGIFSDLSTFLRVDDAVPGELVRATESFVAAWLGTYVGLVAGMGTYMLRQVRGFEKALSQ